MASKNETRVNPTAAILSQVFELIRRDTVSTSCTGKDCKAEGTIPVWSERKKDYIGFCQPCYDKLIDSMMARK